MSRCRSCAAEIIWAHTEKGKRIPLDAEPVEGGNIELRDGIATIYGQAIFGTEALYVSHFATCPDAAEHRSRR